MHTKECEVATPKRYPGVTKPKRFSVGEGGQFNKKGGKVNGASGCRLL